jgi:hypothetical protein
MTAPAAAKAGPQRKAARPALSPDQARMDAAAAVRAGIDRAGTPRAQIRQAVGMTQRVWAQKLATGRWTVDDLGKLSQALGVCPSELFPDSWRAATT